MKKKTKAISILLTGVALAIGIAVSNGIIQNAYHLDEVKAATTYSNTISAQTWSSYGVQTLSGVSWTAAATGGSYFAYDQTKGQQFGSENKPAKPLTLSTSGISGNITSISISTSGASSVSATIGVTVGGSAYGGAAKSISSSNASYSFTGSASGSIVFTWTQSSSKALYLKAISIEYSTKTLSNISVTGTPSKTSYFVGESFNSSGLTIMANYSDSSSSDVTSSCTYLPNPLTAGTTSVTASYTESSITKQATIDGLTVSERNLVSIAVTTNPSKMAYVVGEAFNPAGMVITATYDAGSPVVGYSNYTYSPTVAFGSAGTKTITIMSSDDNLITASFQVQVADAPSITELFISEYIEGSSNNKAIEIFNGTGSAISLASYSLKIFSNGSSSANNTLSLSGTIANNDVYITANSSASLAAITSAADNTNATVTAFNGDDAIGLYKNGTLIDLIGIIGNAPGTGWTGTAANGAGSTEDRTLVRISSITAPNATFTWLEWNAYAIDTVTYLGSHTITSAPTQAQLDAVAYGTSFLSATADGCSTANSSTLSGVWSSLESSYNALSNDAKAYLTGLTPNVSGNDAQHAVARYIHIITKYGEATFNDFMNLDLQSAPSSSDVLALDSYDFLPLIAVISVVGLTILIGYYYHNKRKEA